MKTPTIDMSRRTELRLRMLSLLLVSICGAACDGERPVPPAGAPNLLLVTVDTLRADHLEAWGYARDTSTHLERLGEEGAVFLDAQVQWPKTSPSLASLHTSTYPVVNGVRRLRVPLEDDWTTLAEMLRERGWRTAAFVANVNAGSVYGFDQGFDTFVEMWNAEDEPGSNQEATFWSNATITRRLQEWIGEAPDEPFFLWVHYLDPHGPYRPPEPLDDRFVGDELHERATVRPEPDRLPDYQKGHGHTTRGDYVAAYDAEIVSTDAAIGQLVEALDRRGWLDDTLVAITADHGESLGEHGYWFNHGHYLYEDCTRVPLVLRWPGRVPAGARVDTPVPLLDLLPTLLELVGTPAEPYRDQIQGQSLLPHLGPEPPAPRPIFIEATGDQIAVRHGPFKYVHDPRESTRMYPVVREQLFDLSTDRGETRNLIDEHPDVAAGLRELGARWRESMQGLSPGDPLPLGDEELGPEHLEKLRSLGYLGTIRVAPLGGR